MQDHKAVLPCQSLYIVVFINRRLIAIDDKGDCQGGGGEAAGQGARDDDLIGTFSTAAATQKQNLKLVFNPVMLGSMYLCLYGQDLHYQLTLGGVDLLLQVTDGLMFLAGRGLVHRAVTLMHCRW